MACAYCLGPLPPGLRADALYCSKRCRQAACRFRQEIGVRETAERSLRLAYADPPYPGKAHLYAGRPDYAGEVDHRALLSRLQGYDGWALSTSAEALPDVLALCRELGLTGHRVAAWVRGHRPGPARGPRNGWEPVVYRCARHVLLAKPPVDTLVHGARPRLVERELVLGAKPAAFCGWLFDLLGARPGDELDDLYPGSGGVGRAWGIFSGRADVSRSAEAGG